MAKLKETETRLQLRVQEAQRRENVLNMRLATKQQETQEIMVSRGLKEAVVSRGLKGVMIVTSHMKNVLISNISYYSHTHTYLLSPSLKCTI